MAFITSNANLPGNFEPLSPELEVIDAIINLDPQRCADLLRQMESFGPDGLDDLAVLFDDSPKKKEDLPELPSYRLLITGWGYSGPRSKAWVTPDAFKKPNPSPGEQLLYAIASGDHKMAVVCLQNAQVLERSVLQALADLIEINEKKKKSRAEKFPKRLEIGGWPVAGRKAKAITASGVSRPDYENKFKKSGRNSDRFLARRVAELIAQGKPQHAAIDEVHLESDTYSFARVSIKNGPVKFSKDKIKRAFYKKARSTIRGQ